MEHFGRRPISQGLMGPQVIVEPEVGSQFSSGLDGVEVGFQVDLLVLQRAAGKPAGVAKAPATTAGSE